MLRAPRRRIRGGVPVAAHAHGDAPRVRRRAASRAGYWRAKGVRCLVYLDDWCFLSDDDAGEEEEDGGERQHLIS